MDSYNKLNQILVDLFNNTLDLERKVVINEEFKDISMNDMHIMDTIGIESSRNMSSIAKAMGVTVGTLTIAINGLVKKGYVTRTRSEEDRRVVLIALSPKGERAYHHHEKFHLLMIKAMRNSLDNEQCQVLITALSDLSAYFDRSPKGERAYHHHEKFHLLMIKAMRNSLDNEQCQVLITALSDLSAYFDRL